MGSNKDDWQDVPHDDWQEVPTASGQISGIKPDDGNFHANVWPFGDINLPYPKGLQDTHQKVENLLRDAAVKHMGGDEQAGLEHYYAGKQMRDNIPNQVAGIIGSGMDISGLGEMAGALPNKLSDHLSQASVGIKKYIPGNGNKLLDMGVWGTRKGMQKTLSELSPQLEDQLQGHIQGLDPVNNAKVANTVRGADVSSRMTSQDIPGRPSSANITTGEVADGAEEKVGALNELADSIASKGPAVSAQDALTQKRALNNNQAFSKTKSGNKKFTDDGTAARIAGQAYDTELSNGWAAKHGQTEQSAPDGWSQQNAKDNPNQYDETNNKYSAVTKASKAINDPETIHKGLMSLQDIGAMSATAAATQDPVKTAIAYGLSKASKMPVVESSLAKLFRLMGVGTEKVVGSKPVAGAISAGAAKAGSSNSDGNQ